MAAFLEMTSRTPMLAAMARKQLDVDPGRGRVPRHQRRIGGRHAGAQHAGGTHFAERGVRRQKTDGAEQAENEDVGEDDAPVAGKDAHRGQNFWKSRSAIRKNTAAVTTSTIGPSRGSNWLKWMKAPRSASTA